MTDHPLTDEKCNKLSIFDLDECSAAYAYGIMTDMRTAYDKGGEDMLEQVLKFMEENGFGIRKILLLKDAMRPQQQENN